MKAKTVATEILLKSNKNFKKKDGNERKDKKTLGNENGRMRTTTKDFMDSARAEMSDARREECWTGRGFGNEPSSYY